MNKTYEKLPYLGQAHTLLLCEHTVFRANKHTSVRTHCMHGDSEIVCECVRMCEWCEYRAKVVCLSV